MKIILHFTFYILFSNSIFSQTVIKTVNPNQEETGLKKEFKTLVLDGSNLTLNVIGEFKDELSAWKEKIVSVSIDESNHRVTLIHNKLLEQQELFDVIKKYHFPKASIISYN